MLRYKIQSVISTEPEFCASCGSILPVPTGTLLDSQCYTCTENVDSSKDKGTK